MKINKVISIFLLLFTTTLFAHKIAGVELEVKKIENDKIHINAFFKKSKRALAGNKIKLISMIDNRVLFEDKLSKKGLITNIPNESYWVYLIVRDNDVVKDGPAPNKGFKIEVKKEAKAFLYTSITSFIFIFLSIILMFRSKKQKLEKSY